MSALKARFISTTITLSRITAGRRVYRYTKFNIAVVYSTQQVILYEAHRIYNFRTGIRLYYTKTFSSYATVPGHYELHSGNAVWTVTYCKCEAHKHDVSAKCKAY
jgi:hypothetical protein